MILEDYLVDHFENFEMNHEVSVRIEGFNIFIRIRPKYRDSTQFVEFLVEDNRLFPVMENI